MTDPDPTRQEDAMPTPTPLPRCPHVPADAQNPNGCGWCKDGASRN